MSGVEMEAGTRTHEQDQSTCVNYTMIKIQ
jgi:hypothetical protein